MAELALFAIAIFGFAMFSGRATDSPITSPMVFTSIGLLIGPAGLGWFNLDLQDEAVVVLVEATLVLVLFTDAVRIDLRVLGRESWLPTRLLAIGLPLSILLGFGLAMVVFPTLTVVEAALLAAVVAPTDAALGRAVVTDDRLPVRLRQGLNAESGLNDGIVLPVVTALIAVTATMLGTGGPDVGGEFLARQLGFGLGCGVVVGGAGGWLLQRRAMASAVDGVFRQLATLAVAAGAFATAELLGGNGFIAAFTAGLAFGAVAREQCKDVQDFTEDEGELLAALVFVLFGAALAGPLLADLEWTSIAYAVASLVGVRVLATLVALWRSGTLIETRLFAGWFGPRGLATILFALLIIEQLDGPGVDLVFRTAVATVLISVFAHGLSANAWTGRLARRLARAPEHQPERMPATEMPTRWTGPTPPG